MNKARHIGERFGRLATWFFVVSAIMFYGYTTWIDADAGATDIGAFVLNTVLLVIAARTLLLTIPERAKLVIERQHELNVSDLIFFEYITPGKGTGEPGIPRDYLLQLHAAVANIGGRKAILAAATIEALIAGSGTEVRIGVEDVNATQYSTRTRWEEREVTVNQRRRYVTQRTEIRDQISGPFLLAPDDVISLRFRHRFGIDWSHRWDLDRLRELELLLVEPLVKARVKLTYRRGAELVDEITDVPIQVIQQQEYRKAIRAITQELTALPEGLHQPIIDG